MITLTMSGSVVVGLTIAAVIIPAFIAFGVGYLADHKVLGPRGFIVGMAIWLIVLLGGLVYIISLPWDKINWGTREDFDLQGIGVIIAVFVAVIIIGLSVWWLFESAPDSRQSNPPDNKEDNSTRRADAE